MTLSAAPSPVLPLSVAGEVHVHLVGVRAGQVVHGDFVGAGQRVEHDVLRVVQVHDDVGDVACEQHAPAVRRDVDLLRDCSRR